VGALLSHDFRFKMRVWFLKPHESICPGCSTGCSIDIDERDGEVHRMRPRRNPDVNKSWMCDPGRALYREIGLESRITGARLKGGTDWESVPLAAALERVAAAVRDAGGASAFVATPKGSNEDLFAFKSLADTVGGRLDFRVGDPQLRVREMLDGVLQHKDRNPNTQGCLDQGLGREGISAIIDACEAGRVKALVLQGPELLRVPAAAAAIAKVPFIAIMATHEEPALARAHVVLPAAVWAEAEGTFTNYQRRVQRFRKAVPAPGDALPMWELAAGLLERLGQPLAASSAREVFGLLALSTRDYGGLDYKALGKSGRALPLAEPAPAGTAQTGTAEEARV
jgi:NADH-quinone oxidoreductase subunit G